MAVNWFKGDITTAVNDAKRQQANLMIFVTSDEEYTIMYENVLKSMDFSKKKYIALKLTAYTKEYEQFKAIYRIVPVPSILVIDWESGLVMERISGAIFDEELQEALLDAIPDLPNDMPSLSNPVQIPKFEAASTSKQVKIQFKVTSGETKTKIYEPNDCLAILRNDAASLFKINSFILAVPYPRRTLTMEDDSISLHDLSLTPSSTILVIPTQNESLISTIFFDPIWKVINTVLTYFRGVWQRFVRPTYENKILGKKNN